MKKLLLFCLMLSVLACSKEDTENDLVVTEPVPEGQIDLSAPIVGQKSFFVNYISDCADMEGNFELIGDTLVLEVIEENEALFIKEQLTANSVSVINGHLNEPVVYPIHCDGKKVLLPERNNAALFYFYGNDTLRLQSNLEVNLEQQDCKLFDQENVFTGDAVGYLKSFKVGNVELQDKMAVSCVPIITIDAYLIHDEKRLYASHAVHTSDFMGNINISVNGWALIEE